MSSVGWGVPVMFDANAVALENSKNTQVIEGMKETNERLEAMREASEEKRESKREMEDKQRLVDTWA